MLILPRLICLDRNSTWNNFNNVLLTFLEKQNCRKSAYLLFKKLIIFCYVSESAWMKARLFSREIQLYHTNFKLIAILCRVWQLYVLNILFSVDWYVGSNGIVWKIFSLSPFKLSHQFMGSEQSSYFSSTKTLGLTTLRGRQQVLERFSSCPIPDVYTNNVSPKENKPEDFKQRPLVWAHR